MRSIRTETARKAFLEALEACGSVSAACAAADIARSAAYAWRAADAAFADEWEAALQLGVCGLEDRAAELAMSGNEKLMMFLLQANRPDKYGTRHTIDLNQNVQLSIRQTPLQALREELAGLIAPPAPLIQHVIDAEEPDNVVDITHLTDR